MKPMQDGDNTLKDIVKLGDHALTLSVIESLAINEKMRKQYEKKYGDRLYPLMLLSLTHESFAENENSF